MGTELYTALRGAFSGRLFKDSEEMAPFLTDWRGPIAPWT